MSRPIRCDGPGCDQFVSPRSTVYVLHAYPPPAPHEPDTAPREPLQLDFCSPYCGANWLLNQVPTNVTPFPA